jgi:hypothetical protein
MRVTKSLETFAPWRRWAATATFATIPAWITGFNLRSSSWDWFFLAFVGTFGAAAFGLSRRSVAAQVLARSVAWVVFLPSLVGALAVLGGGSLAEAVRMAAYALVSGGALLLSRPALATRESKMEFAPVEYRRTFLAGATLSGAAAFLSLASGLWCLSWYHQLSTSTVGAALLATGWLASAIGVLRMRAWGVLLGGLTSGAALAAACFFHDETRIALALGALPGIALAAPVFLARRLVRRSDESSTRRPRVALNPARLRIALPDPLEVPLEEPPADRATPSAMFGRLEVPR